MADEARTRLRRGSPLALVSCGGEILQTIARLPVGAAGAGAAQGRSTSRTAFPAPLRAPLATIHTPGRTDARAASSLAAPAPGCTRSSKWRFAVNRAGPRHHSRNHNAAGRPQRCTELRAAWPRNTVAREAWRKRLRQPPEKRPAGQPRGTVEAPSVSVPHAPEPGRALSREEPARGSPLQPAVSLESSPRQPGQLRQPGSAARRASGKPEIESSVRAWWYDINLDGRVPVSDRKRLARSNARRYRSIISRLNASRLPFPRPPRKPTRPRSRPVLAGRPTPACCFCLWSRSRQSASADRAERSASRRPPAGLPYARRGTARSSDRRSLGRRGFAWA